MSRPLAGQRALVVGGGSGIGRATARALALDGAAVTVAGRTAATLRDTADAVGSQDGVEVAWVVADAMVGEQVAAAVDAASDDRRRLDIAVVVPGGGAVTPVLLFDDDDFSAQVDANVRPVYLTLKYAGRAMVRAGGGSFVAVSSTAAAFSTRYLASYAAGKAAVDQLVRVAADELGDHGVRVNSVRPGLTRTPATAPALAHRRLAAAFLAGQPLARHGEVDDVAQAIRFLAGPESSWVTGQHLGVDGGHTLRSFVDYAAVLDLPDQAEAARHGDGQERWPPRPALNRPDPSSRGAHPDRP